MDELEIRENGGASILHGRLAYGQTATVMDRGKTRKERLGPDALGWQMREFAKLNTQMQTMLSDTFAEARVILEEQLERRNVHVLSGHSLDKPLGDLKGRTARVTSNNDYLDFEVDLPDFADMPTYMQDVVKEVRTGRAGGISPGFRVPPKSAVPNAETFVAEVGNPDVMIRIIHQAVMPEISVVTRPVYPSRIELRAEDLDDFYEQAFLEMRGDLLIPAPPRRVFLCL